MVGYEVPTHLGAKGVAFRDLQVVVRSNDEKFVEDGNLYA
jgi:hypothetical protein